MDAQDFEASVVLLPLVNKAAADPRGARFRTAVIPVTTSSVAQDISGYITEWDQGHYLSLQADGGDVYFVTSDVGTDSIDETSTVAGAVTLCQKIPNGTRWDGCLADGYKYLIVKGSAACKLRVSISSRRPGASASQGDY